MVINELQDIRDRIHQSRIRAQEALPQYYVPDGGDRPPKNRMERFMRWGVSRKEAIKNIPMLGYGAKKLYHLLLSIKEGRR